MGPAASSKKAGQIHQEARVEQAAQLDANATTTERVFPAPFDLSEPSQRRVHNDYCRRRTESVAIM